MLRLVLVFLIAFLTSVILAQHIRGPPTLIIDGYIIGGPIDSPANLPLGTTLVLFCRVGNVEMDEDPNFTWKCLNESCLQNGYAGRNITALNKHDTVLAINITSEHDSGTYTCIVSPEGRQSVRKEFELNVTGGNVVHSYGRLILNEGVISDRRQLQPPNNSSGDGKIECRVRNGEAKFEYYGSNRTNVKYEPKNDGGSNATVFIKEGALASGNFAIEGHCAEVFHYLFLNNDTICNDLAFEYPTFNRSSITVTINELPNGIARAIVGYTRLDFGVPVEGEYENLQACGSRTFSPLAPGAKYRITAWGLGGGSNRRRCQSPTVMEVTTRSKDVGASPPRNITMTRECKDGIELNWIPPKEPNGDILCYNITMQNGTNKTVVTINNTNYHTLTGMEIGQSYTISVAAFNGQLGEKADMNYVHNPNTTLPCKVPEKISSLDITPILINCTAGLLIEWVEPRSTSEIIVYDVRIYLKGKDMSLKRTLNTTKNYQLVPGLNTSTVYRVTVAAISMGGKGDETADEVSTLSVLGFFAECPSIPIPNIVTFNSDSMIVSESETLLHIDVYRYGQMEGLTKLSVTDEPVTAKRFEDYVLQSHFLYFTQTGQLVEKATVVVKIMNDDKKESKEYFELILSTEDTIMFNKRNVTICIKDDENDKNNKQ